MTPADPPPFRATARSVSSQGRLVHASPGRVLWSFFGVRKGQAMARDAVTIKPHHVIIAGVLLAAVLVISLIVLVQIIIRSA